MNTRSRIKNVLILAVVLGIFGVFVGSLQAVVLVYEPFDYTAGTILTGSGGTGFDGAWSTTGNDASTFLFTIRDGGLTFTDSGSIPLKVAGNSVYRPGSTGRTEANRALSAFSQGALFSDGSTIWFSVLYNKTADTGNYFGFVIGTDTFDVASTGALSGYATGGEGFGVGSNYGDKVEAISYDDASGMAAVNSGLVADPVRLIAGKIVWNANGTADELYLYNVTDLLTEPTTPIATITADLDQSNFDRVAIMHNVSNALFDEIRIGTTYSDVVGFSHPMDPCPYDGETVSAGDVELSWKNLPSNADPNGYVWVDVWFGTDPNDFGTPEGPKVLDKEQDATSVIVNAPIAGTPPTTYYWQVDSYLEGSPAGDPNVGDVWIFFASDLPPSVDAGVDMITWSGEAVQLSPSIEDDGHSAVSYSWSAEPADGVVFDPVTADVEDPIVTITKTPGVVEIPIVNAGFEDPVFADGEWAYDLPEPWRDGYYWPSGSNDWVDDDYYAGIENPDTAYGGIVPEGENAAFQYSYYSDTWGGYDMGLRQVLTATLAPEMHYELSVMVGNPDAVASNDYRIELLAGGVVLNSSTGPSPAPDTWTATPVTVTYDSPSTVDVGQALEIRLVLVDDGSTDQLLHFDDVQLTATGSAYPMIVTLTLAVNDEFTPTPVANTMTIDVYDDACKAAVSKDPSAIELGDVDADCDTDIEDYAAMAETWLYDYTLTEPAEKP